MMKPFRLLVISIMLCLCFVLFSAQATAMNHERAKVDSVTDPALKDRAESLRKQREMNLIFKENLGGD